jgi:hypothetical protein
MRLSNIAILSSLLLAVLVPGSAYANHNCSAAPYYVNVGPVPYYEYTKNDLTDAGDASCWILQTGWTAGTLNSTCAPDTDGWEFTGGNNKTMTHTFTVGANDFGSSNWSLSFDVDFVDPNDDWYSQLKVQVLVTHNGSTTTRTIYSRNGLQGDDCGSYYNSFSAVNGDTVQVVVKANDYLGADIKFTDVHIIRWAW